MLVNVKIDVHGKGLREMLTIIGKGGPTPRNLDQVGLYVCRHWSFDAFCREKLENYPEFDFSLEPYGVCDSPEQFMSRFGDALKASPRKFVISFVEVLRSEQAATGGWRWHKWGDYVGVCQPTTEYLADEPIIESVFTYHVYEVKGQ
jgi:hypothetical protein